MAAGRIIVTGDAEINRKLAALAGPTAKAAIRKASRAALRPVAAAAKANAPRRTGLLSRSIKIRAMPRSRQRFGSMVTSSGSGRQFGGKTFYGAPQEYGWQAGRRVRNVDLGAAKGARRNASLRAEATRRNNSRRRIPGKEFMKRAADSKQSMALAIYKTETERWINLLAQA